MTAPAVVSPPAAAAAPLGERIDYASTLSPRTKALVLAGVGLALFTRELPLRKAPRAEPVAARE